MVGKLQRVHEVNERRDICNVRDRRWTASVKGVLVRVKVCNVRDRRWTVKGVLVSVKVGMK
jgi:hypothetical protein